LDRVKPTWPHESVRVQQKHISVSRDTGGMVFSVRHENGTANIGVRLAGESGIKELTEGDSFDTAPHWLPGGQRRILYQTACFCCRQTDGKSAC